MAFKPYVVSAVAIACVFFLLGAVFYDSSERGTQIVRMYEPNGGQVEEMSAVTRILIDQRNNISKQLNLRQQKIGQMQCEVRISEINNSVNLI